MFCATMLAGVIDMTIADALKRFREEKKLTQAELADKLGIFPQAYYRYEKGKIFPPVLLIVKMAQAFDVSADYLLGLRDTPKPLEVSAAEVQMARDFSKALEKFVKVPEVKA